MTGERGRRKGRGLTALLAVLLMAAGLLYVFQGLRGSGGDGPVAGRLTRPGNRTTLVIYSGSENKELEPLLERFVDRERINLDMRYQGSVDIARALQQDRPPFDAVWPASSMWIAIGDTGHRVKYAESVSTTPVVFGIRQSLARKLGFVGREVSVRELLDSIRAGELRFCMTSATQSNSGCSAYMGFLYALTGRGQMPTLDDLRDEGLRQDLQDLLAGVDRSSGSSEWLKTLFLEGDFDAMVNYESLILSTNQALVSQGREPLHIVYPYDGLSISDAPLGYVDQGSGEKEAAFQRLQAYLMSEEVQLEIQGYGRRTGYAGVDARHRAVWNQAWGADSGRILSPIRMPSTEVLWAALDLYQTRLRKPPLTVYVLDYSGSMEGDPLDQLREAMSEILIQEKAARHLLQAADNEENEVILFAGGILARDSASGSAGIEGLYDLVRRTQSGGGTALYEGLLAALDSLRGRDLSGYNPAVILMTDGQANGEMSFRDFQRAWEQDGRGVPVFCISFGGADEEALGRIAELTRARVFSGGSDLIRAFRQAKGYN